MSKQKQKPSFDLLLSKTTYKYTLVKNAAIKVRKHSFRLTFTPTYYCLSFPDCLERFRAFPLPGSIEQLTKRKENSAAT